MPTYKYVALNKSGKQVKQVLEANSIDTAKNTLRGIGYTILDITEVGALNREIDLPFLGNPKSKDMAVFCRQFVSILRAGVPVTAVLAMLSQQTENKKLRSAIRTMQADVEKGDSLAGAMKKHPKIFSSMLCNMIAAGEESGNLEASFEQMEVYFDKARQTRNAIVRAMIYPCILIVVMIVVLFVMMTKIIPQFLKTFDDLEIELPAVTRAVMAVSNWFVDWWWLLLTIMLVLIIGNFIFSKTNQGKHFFGWLSRKIPVVKLLTVRSACATFCRTLALLLSSGIGLVDGLELTAANLGNIWFKEGTMNSRLMVSQGYSLSTSLQDTKLFPPMVTNMVGIGEESGDLEEMLSKTADYYDDEVTQATEALLALMEPAIILFLAVFVVIIVLSIFLPMLSMTQAFDQYL